MPDGIVAFGRQAANAPATHPMAPIERRLVIAFDCDTTPQTGD
jgi:hypothetical protein